MVRDADGALLCLVIGHPALFDFARVGNRRPLSIPHLDIDSVLDSSCHLTRCSIPLFVRWSWVSRWKRPECTGRRASCAIVGTAPYGIVPLLTLGANDSSHFADSRPSSRPSSCPSSCRPIVHVHSVKYTQTRGNRLDHVGIHESPPSIRSIWCSPCCRCRCGGPGRHCDGLDKSVVIKWTSWWRRPFG